MKRRQPRFSEKEQQHIKRVVKFIDSRPWIRMQKAVDSLKYTTLLKEVSQVNDAFNDIALALNSIERKVRRDGATGVISH